MKSVTLPLLVSTRNMQSLVGRTKIEIDDARVEAVTGRVRDIGKALQGDVGSVHRLDKLIADADRRISSLNLLESEAKNVQSTLTRIQETVLDIGVSVEAALGLEDEQSLRALTTDAEAELTAIWGRLNSNFNGQYQFSGAATDTQPLGDLNTFIADIRTIVSGAATAGAATTALDTYFDDTATGTFHTVTYQGSQVAGPDKQVSESRRLGVDVKATDTGVRNALRGLVLLTVADSATTPEIAQQLKSDAAQTLSNGGTQIINKQAQIGTIEADTQKLLTQQQSEKAAYEFLMLDKVGVEQYEAASRMQLLESQLEATYLTTARMVNLSLVNYL